MLKRFTAGIAMRACITVVVLTQINLLEAQAWGGQRGGRGAGRGEGQGAAQGGGRGDAQAATVNQEQWNKPEVQAFVATAKALAGNDPDLQYDFSFNCTPEGSHIAGGGNATMTVGDGAILQNSDPKIPYVAVPQGQGALPPQRIFDNLWRFGGTGVGAWLITSNDGYILFDTLNDASDARDVIVEGMKKVGLDPTKSDTWCSGTSTWITPAAVIGSSRTSARR
jgi:hypothetical protein